MGQFNLLAIAKDALALVGTGSIVILYWGYVAAQEPVRVLFSGTLPFTPQDYYIYGLRHLIYISPATLYGVVVGLRSVDRPVTAASRGWYPMIPSIAVFTIALILDVFYTDVRPAGWWGVAVTYLSTALISFSFGSMAGLTIKTLDVEAKLQKDSETIAERRREHDRGIQELTLKLDAQHHDPDDLDQLITRATVKHMTPPDDAVQDRKDDTSQMEKLHPIPWTTWSVICVLTLMVYVSISSNVIRALNTVDTPTKRYREVLVTTKSAVTEFSPVSPGTYSYRLRIVARADGQLFLFDADSQRSLVLPLSEVVRVSYTPR